MLSAVLLLLGGLDSDSILGTWTRALRSRVEIEWPDDNTGALRHRWWAEPCLAAHWVSCPYNGIRRRWMPALSDWSWKRSQAVTVRPEETSNWLAGVRCHLSVAAAHFIGLPRGVNAVVPNPFWPVSQILAKKMFETPTLTYVYLLPQK